MYVLTQSTGLTSSGVFGGAGAATGLPMNAAAARAGNTLALRISTLDPQRLALEGVQMQVQASVCADIQHRRLRIEDIDRLRIRRRAANEHRLIHRSIPEVDRRNPKSRLLRQVL